MKTRFEIQPHKGLCGGVETDTGLDAVWQFDAVYPKGLRIALADRTPGAPLQLLVNASEAVIAEAQKLLDDRDFGDLPDDKQALGRGQRWIQHPPAVIEDEE
jgi:hypothetical protein